MLKKLKNKKVLVIAAIFLFLLAGGAGAFLLTALKNKPVETNEDAYVVAQKLDVLHKMSSALGCKLDSPFMTMAFMALLVIPSLKISDLGLFDGDSFEFIDVIKN